MPARPFRLNPDRDHDFPAQWLGTRSRYLLSRVSPTSTDWYRMRSAPPRLFIALAFVVSLVTGALPAGAQPDRRLTVVEESGGVVTGASVILRGATGTVLWQASTGSDGSLTIEPLPQGQYWLEVSAPGFQIHRSTIDVDAGNPSPVKVVLGLAGFQSEVTVTAARGEVDDVDRTAAVVTVREADQFRRRPLATIGNALEGAPGVLVQQSTYGQVSPFLRGLTGYHVVNLVDGVRFNNSTFRSGPNQYLSFIDPSHVQRIEVTLGPASAQFGSDALGGAIQVLSPTPPFSDSPRLGFHGGASLFGGSADQSFGGDASALVTAAGAVVTVGASERRLGDLRAGGGDDSHQVLYRLFGLSGDQVRDVVGSRQVDTGFAQSAAHAKMAIRLPGQQTVTARYQFSSLDDVRGYKDLWGGLGRLRSDFQPQRLHLFYGRYETLQVGRLDWLSATFSLNSQRDGSLRQNLRATDPIVVDDVEVNVLGYSAQAGAHLGGRQALVFGGEVYDERVDARRDETSPSTGTTVPKRALYPNGSTYRTIGFFVQDTVDILGGSERRGLEATLSARFSRVDVETFADRNVTPDGRSLGVVDSSQSHQDWTFNGSLVWQLADALTVNALVGRGFRAPNLNDLGALGLNDLGYEIPGSATLDAESYIGASDGEGVASSGRRVDPLQAERLFNYELGTVLRWRRLSARANVFYAEFKDPIVRRTLLFPADRPPSSLAGLTVTPIPPTAAQSAQGVVAVATSFDQRAVKAFVNDGEAEYYGVDAVASLRASRRWTVEGSYSYLVGHDLHPTRPVRRLPPQHGSLSARFQPPGGRVSWLGATVLFAGPQDHLSGGDLTDERIGAARRRSDITAFFQGDLIRPYLASGPDGLFGTGDDVFQPTGETAAQIRDRVLPIGATINGVTVVDDGTRVPLYLRTPGFVTVSLGGGLSLGRHLSADVSIVNLFDRNCRVHGSGMDSPGVGAYARIRVSY
jgi:hemoglobin/transferrin/lactoferrin receptor protein